MKTAPFSYVVEWNEADQVFRARTVAEYMESNVRQFYCEDRPEFLPIAFFDSAEEAARFLENRTQAAA